MAASLAGLSLESLHVSKDISLISVGVFGEWPRDSCFF